MENKKQYVANLVYEDIQNTKRKMSELDRNIYDYKLAIENYKKTIYEKEQFFDELNKEDFNLEDLMQKLINYLTNKLIDNKHLDNIDVEILKILVN